ncbi:MAG: M28 family peptidase, partial [Deltaproteobacteria bacterium]|nr:M28 family peptidase [Deltaproteobacteria bacterium]
DYVSKFCKKLNVSLRKDKYGNLIAHYKLGQAKQPVILTAHMDHPGFEIAAVKNGRLCTGILGGIKPEYFDGAKVCIMTSGGIIKGKVAGKLGNKKWHGKHIFEIKAKNGYKAKSGNFGWYDIPPFRISGGLLYTKGADNLVSAAALLELLHYLKRNKIAADVRCLFTRAEEVGFIGCVAFSKSVQLPRNAPIIVLECSSASAGGVKIGSGPVLRVGDKMSCFTPEIDCWLKSISNDLAKKNKKFKFQRALLSGGTCEASVWTINGRKVGGLAFPLGNYHNNGRKNYAPEFISISDYKLMQKLLVQIIRAGNYKEAIKKTGAGIFKNYRDWVSKLC